jgi:hypothetical protein
MMPVDCRRLQSTYGADGTPYAMYQPRGVRGFREQRKRLRYLPWGPLRVYKATQSSSGDSGKSYNLVAYAGAINALVDSLPPTFAYVRQCVMEVWGN